MRLHRLVPLVVLPVALLAGCSMGRSEFNGNLPDGTTSKEPVVRTPSPVGTDLPYSQAPIVQGNPGPSGGVPGTAPTTVPPATQGSDGGSGPAN